MIRRLKILVSAYACSPYKGSEPGVGWGFVNEMAKHHNLWVIVEEEKFRQDIETYLEKNPDFSQSAHFFFLRKQRNRKLRKIWPPSYYWYYRLWHKDAFELGRNLHTEIGFDLAHQLTMVGFREPGYLWQLDIPFVWGPIGGLGVFPWRFLPKVGLYGALYYLGYNLFNQFQMRFMKRPKLAALAAGAGLISATPENRDEALRLWKNPSTVITEVGLPQVPVIQVKPRMPIEPLRIIWTGLHVPRKALNLGLEALAKLPVDTKWELHVLGEGKRTANWRLLSKRLGLESRCNFHGWLPRDQALQIMSSSHVMLITSLRDLTSTVTIEAMALGLPIVCLNHCGFSHVVNNTCGIKIPVTTPKSTVKGLSDALAILAENEGLRQEFAQGALEHGKAFSWEKKIAVLNRIYAEKMMTAVHTSNLKQEIPK